MDDIFSDPKDDAEKEGDSNIEWKKSGIDKHERLTLKINVREANLYNAAKANDLKAKNKARTPLDVPKGFKKVSRKIRDSMDEEEDEDDYILVPVFEDMRESSLMRALSEEEKKINEVNSGMYVFDAQSLVYALDKITPNNAQGEYYLTDTLEILLSAGKKIGGYAISDNDEIRGINDRVQLNEAEKIMQKRINEYHMRNGVTMRNPESVYIEDGVEIGNDTEICQNVTIKSGTKIGSDCVIGSGSMLDRAVIHDGVDVLSSVILESEVDEGTHVGPFAYIRPNCHVGKEVKVGDFVELKNSNIDDGTKISHLTYIGDSDVGKRVNFGCGTVTCNYDGKKKYRTTIGDDCFVGCNTNFVSPINVGDGVYIAAGSTITEDIPENSLSIARARQVNKEGWKDKRK